jgi:hypothetical protein
MQFLRVSSHNLHVNRFTVNWAVFWEENCENGTILWNKSSKINSNFVPLCSTTWNFKILHRTDQKQWLKWNQKKFDRRNFLSKVVFVLVNAFFVSQQLVSGLLCVDCTMMSKRSWLLWFYMWLYVMEIEQRVNHNKLKATDCACGYRKISNFLRFFGEIWKNIFLAKFFNLKKGAEKSEILRYWANS